MFDDDTLMRHVRLHTGHEVKLFATDKLINCGGFSKDAIGYQLIAPDGAVIFEGEDYGASPMHAIDGDESLRSLLGFLTLRPGDTDPDYFEGYTPEQMAFAESFGEEVSLYQWVELTEGWELGQAHSAARCNGARGRPGEEQERIMTTTTEPKTDISTTAGISEWIEGLGREGAAPALVHYVDALCLNVNVEAGTTDPYSAHITMGGVRYKLRFDPSEFPWRVDGDESLRSLLGFLDPREFPWRVLKNGKTIAACATALRAARALVRTALHDRFEAVDGTEPW